MKTLVLASLLALASIGNLSATLLSTLVAGGSLSNGLLTLDDFTFVRNCSGPGVCAPLDASGIDVSLTLNTIHITGGFTALGIGSVTTADFVLAYDIASPLIGINAVQLLFNGAVVGNQSFAQVVETVVTGASHLAVLVVLQVLWLAPSHSQAPTVSRFTDEVSKQDGIYRSQREGREIARCQ
jgi:hypothetical protein